MNRGGCLKQVRLQWAKYVQMTGLAVLMAMVSACSLPSGNGKRDAGPVAPPVAALEQQFHDQSWQTLIAEDCMQYFDGCNNCTRTENSSVAACTEKMCVEYRKPVCLDRPDQLTWHCPNQQNFTVFYKTFPTAEGKRTLNEGEIMLFDSQTLTSSLLIREPSGSGEKYSGSGLLFWEKGGEARLQRDGKSLYGACQRR